MPVIRNYSAVFGELGYPYKSVALLHGRFGSFSLLASKDEARIAGYVCSSIHILCSLSSTKRKAYRFMLQLLQQLTHDQEATAMKCS